MSSTDTENTWKCPSCGAMNEEFRKFCDGCGDKRPGAAVTAAKGISMDEILGSSPSSPSQDQPEVEEEKPKGKPKKAKKEKKSKKKAEDEEMEEPERLQPSIPAPEPFTAPEADTTGDFESKPSTDDSGSKPFVVTGPEPAPSFDDTSPKDTFSSFQSTPTLSEPPAPSAPSAPLPAGARYYLVFVSTPASSLVKTRVAVEFEDFPTVTIGRSPENVVVIPDPEVSRKHASLNFDGRRITLKDLGSSNGSFVYNGADFQRVSDSVEVRPNTVIKFGTGTIVKLVTE